MNVITHSRSAVYCNEWPGWRNFWNLKAAVYISHMLQLHYTWVRNSKLLSTTHHLWNVFGDGYENCPGMYHAPWIPSIVHPVWVACCVTQAIWVQVKAYTLLLCSLVWLVSFPCMFPMPVLPAVLLISAPPTCATIPKGCTAEVQPWCTVGSFADSNMP